VPLLAQIVGVAADGGHEAESEEVDG
jgi:hypothetical protein